MKKGYMMKNINRAYYEIKHVSHVIYNILYGAYNAYHCGIEYALFHSEK